MNPQLLLASYAKKQLSDSGGRQVVDKMFDVSLNRRIVEWSGTDRPEFTDFGGISKVCVEAERTNLFLNSDSLSTQAVTVSAEAYTVSMEGTGSITFSGDHTGTLEGIEGERVSTTFTPGAGSVTCTVSGTVTNGQFEAGSYPTNYIPTSGSPVTRLAPTVTIEDALPLTGTVAGVVDMVRDESINNYIFDTGGTVLVNRSLLLIRGVNDDIRVDMFGYELTRVRPFPFPPNTRERFAFQITYRSGLLMLTILHGGNIYKLTDSSYSPVDQSRKDVMLGARSTAPEFASTHFEVPWHKDEIDRTGATDDEIKAFFEFLTLGTSMQMTADEMEIVS